MSFLAKAAQILLKFTAILTGVEPLVQPFVAAASPTAGNVVSTATSELTQIAAEVTNIEAIAGALKNADGTTPLSGQKAKAIAPIVSQIILQSPFMVGKKIADPTKFQAAVTAIGGNVADLLDSLHSDGLNSQNVA